MKTFDHLWRAVCAGGGRHGGAQFPADGALRLGGRGGDRAGREAVPDSGSGFCLFNVRDSLGLVIIVVNPDRKITSKTLMQSATAVRQLREGVLAACQFPDIVRYPKGVIRKPATW
ncbi:MAG: hypothetical protein C0410_06655 [Anaerolinea sp.]|nr:hypothetical protein [Anaerolinea sp.]